MKKEKGISFLQHRFHGLVSALGRSSSSSSSVVTPDAGDAITFNISTRLSVSLHSSRQELLSLYLMGATSAQ